MKDNFKQAKEDIIKVLIQRKLTINETTNVLDGVKKDIDLISKRQKVNLLLLALSS